MQVTWGKREKGQKGEEQERGTHLHGGTAASVPIPNGTGVSCPDGLVARPSRRSMRIVEQRSDDSFFLETDWTRNVKISML